jgi:hypothetical protein
MARLARKTLVLAVLALALAGVGVPAVLAAETATSSGGSTSGGVAGYRVVFTGSGTFTSTDVKAVPGTGQCVNATDKVVENSAFSWDTSYTILVSNNAVGQTRTAPGTLSATTRPGTWQQTSTVSPSSCMGGSQECRSSLWPASRSHPATENDMRAPELTMVVSGQTADTEVQSVVDWVAGSDQRGSADCSIYQDFHVALVPFSATVGFPGTSGLTVATAMAASVHVPLAKLTSGKPFTITVPRRQNPPPENCIKLTIDSVSCSEQLAWHGTIAFKPT